MAFLTELNNLPPVGQAYYNECSEVDKGYQNSYGGGYQVATVKFGPGTLELGDGCTVPGDMFIFKLSYQMPCGGCTKYCETEYRVVENPDFPGQPGVFYLDQQFACGQCGGLVCITPIEIGETGQAYQITSKVPGLVFEASIMAAVEPYNVPDFGFGIDTPATPLGSINPQGIPVGRVVTQTLTSEFYNPKTAHLPQGGEAPDEVFLGLVQAAYDNTKSDYDNCCPCEIIDRCNRFCVTLHGNMVVELNAPLPVLPVGDMYVVGYLNVDPVTDPASGQIVVALASAGLPANAVEIAGAKVHTEIRGVQPGATKVVISW